MRQLPDLTNFEVDKPTRSAVNAYVKSAREALRLLNAPRLERVVLYGSRARGSHTPESDVDIALVLKGKDIKRSRIILWDIGDMTYESEAEHSFVVSPIVLWSDILNDPSLSNNPDFYKSVLHDGIEWPLHDG